MIIPIWLKKRPVYFEDASELKRLYQEQENVHLGDITVEMMKDYYQKNPGTTFYKLIRILGFYGIKFIGKLESYSGPVEKNPDVFIIPVKHRNNRVARYINNQSVSSLFHNSGISHLKLLHVFLVKSDTV